jgi:hypothetical protein
MTAGFAVQDHWNLILHSYPRWRLNILLPIPSQSMYNFALPLPVYNFLFGAALF